MNQKFSTDAMLQPGHAQARGLRVANEIGLIAGLLLLYLVLGLLAPNFMSWSNQLNVLREAAFVGIVAWGMTLVLIAGEIDISVGPHVAFSGILLAKLAQTGVDLWQATALVLLVGAAIGCAAGWLRARWEVPSFIVTLSLWLALRGIAEVMSDAVPIVIANDSFQRLGAGSLGPVPIPVIVSALLFGSFSFIASRTVFGRSVYAVGGNAEAALLSGIPVLRVRTAVFGISGLLAALCGVLVASRLGSGNSGAASGFEFDVIAAVVVGGTSLFGGRGSMLGTMLGVLFIAALVNGLVLMGVDPFAQGIVRGVVILAAVLINLRSVKKMGR